MLNQVILETSAPMTLNVTGVDPSEPLIIESAPGLTSTKATLFTGDFAGDDSYYQGRRVGGRNVVFNFKLNPNYATNVSVGQIRRMLYRQFHEPQAGSDAVQVRVKDDELPDLFFIGYTEAIDCDAWVKESKAQVSMMTTEAYLRSVVATNFNDANGVFSVNIAYDGSADTGIELTLKIKTATNTVTVDIGGTLMVLVKPSGTYAVNDIITINTNTRARSIKLNGVDIMAHLTAASRFVQLTQINNAFKTYGSVLNDGKVAMTAYTYRSAWWGI